MATICKRKYSNGKIKYQAKIRVKGHPPVSETFDSKSKAAKWARDTEKAIEEGLYFSSLESRKHTFAELIDRYIVDVLPYKYAKEKDREGIKKHLNWWKGNLGAYLLIDITPVLLSEYRDKLKKEPYVKFKRTSNKPKDKKQNENKGHAPEEKQEKPKKPVERERSNSTVNRYMASLSTALTVAVNEWGWLQENPMTKVRKKQEPRGRVRFLSDEERSRLLEACQNVSNPNLYIVVTIALTTGARFSEIMNLKWQDIDFKRKKIYFLETKNKDRRSATFFQELAQILEKHKKVRKINSKYIFPSRQGDKPMELKRQWENAIKKAGLEDFKFHDLRHTAASYLAMNGASLLELSHILGHRTLNMVKRYAHLADQHTDGVLEKLNNQLFKAAEAKAN